MTGVREKFAGENASRDEPVTPPCGFSSTKSKTEPKPSLVMKPIIPFALLGALFAVGAANAQSSTTPVGYVTQTLVPNQFNLVGLTVHNPVVSAGVLDAESATSVSDTGVDFSALLTAGATYILELSDGTIQEIAAWSGDTLTTPQDISAKVTPGTTSYKLRKASTVSDVFGATNSVGLTPTPDGNPSVADKILIPNASNGFDTVFYFNDGLGVEGWLDGDGNLAADKVISYPDGLFVQRVAGDPVNLVVTGEVKTTATAGVLVNGFNYLNAVAPVGLTLGTSGLQASLTASADGNPATADNVLLPNASGGYVTAFYFNYGQGVEGWLDSEGNLAADYDLEDGFLVLNRGAAKAFSLSVPTSYSSL